MRTFIFIVFSILPLISSGQSNIKLDRKIDSLNKMITKNIEDKDLLRIHTQIRQLKIKKNLIEKPKFTFPNLDSIHQSQIIVIEHLWEVSKLYTISKSQRDSLYKTILSYNKGLDHLIENVDHFQYDYDGPSGDELNHYPVCVFLYGNVGSTIYDYVDEKIFEEAYVDKLQYLLICTVDKNEINDEFFKQKLKQYRESDRVGARQKNIIKWHLESIR